MAKKAVAKGSTQSVNWLRLGAIVLISAAIVLVVAKLFGKGGILSRVWGGVEDSASWLGGSAKQAAEWTGDQLEDGLHLLEKGASNAYDWFQDIID